jgi:hypothetical protein
MPADSVRSAIYTANMQNFLKLQLIKLTQCEYIAVKTTHRNGSLRYVIINFFYSSWFTISPYVSREVRCVALFVTG